MDVGDKVKFTYGNSSYVYRGTVEKVIPAGKHQMEYGFHIPEIAVRKQESFLVRCGSIVFWPETMRFL